MTIIGDADARDWPLRAATVMVTGLSSVRLGYLITRSPGFGVQMGRKSLESALGRGAAASTSNR